MNHRINRVRTAAVAVLLLVAAPVRAQSSDAAPVIEPQLDRREVTVPRIRSSDIELGAYAGTLSVENFGSRAVRGVRLAYHVTDRFFIEGVSGSSTVSDQFYRDRAFPVFDRAVVPLRYYNVSAAYSLLPGESFVTRNWAMSSSFYFIAGLGSTSIDREKFSTFNFGFGYRLLLTDWLALRLDVRDHVFNSDLLGRNQRTDNFEMTAGMTVFF